MAKWVLGLLALGAFAMALTSHFRERALVTAERQRIEAQNEAERQRPDGPRVIEVSPQVWLLQAQAMRRGEVWFFLTPVAWAVLGAAMGLAAAIAFGLALRKRRKASPPNARS
jgi:hypothetical protein